MSNKIEFIHEAFDKNLNLKIDHINALLFLLFHETHNLYLKFSLTINFNTTLEFLKNILKYCCYYISFVLFSDNKYKMDKKQLSLFFNHLNTILNLCQFNVYILIPDLKNIWQREYESIDRCLKVDCHDIGKWFEDSLSIHTSMPITRFGPTTIL